jgi:hypothetical protein
MAADKYGDASAGVFDLQDKITESVVGAVEPSVQKAEIERVRGGIASPNRRSSVLIHARSIAHPANVSFPRRTSRHAAPRIKIRAEHHARRG